MLDAPSDKDYTRRFRLVLSRFFQSIKSVDLEAVVVPYEQKIKRLEEGGEEVILCSRKDCVDHFSKLPRSITQLHKNFLKGKLKRGSGAIFTNCLILHTE